MNQGLLDRAKFEPAVRKAWAALVGCVDADGKLTHVQPIGADPKKFAEDSTGPLWRRRVSARGQRGLSDGGFGKQQSQLHVLGNQQFRPNLRTRL